MKEKGIKVTVAESGQVEIKGIYRISTLELPSIGAEVVIENAETFKKQLGEVTGVNLKEHTYDIRIKE